MREYLLVLLVAAGVTYLLTPLVRRLAVAIGAQHVPRSRDVHVKPTPLLGGLAMFAGLVAGLGVTLRLSYLQQAFAPHSRYALGLLLAAALLVVVGFIDDRWEMGPITKMAGQVAAGGVLVWSGVQVPWIPTPNGNLISFDGLQSVTLTIVLVVITINAVNFIDGLDGLAAGVAAIAALSFLVYSYTLDTTLGLPSQSLAAVSSALLAGMCLGFLPHNFHPARIFMGDTGAMLLGLLLAYGPITSLQSLDPSLLTGYAYSHLHPLNRFPTILPLILPAAILIIPYVDMMLAVVRRYRAGKSPWAADKEHLHHRLQNIGHSHRQSVLILYLWAALFSGTVLALSVLRTNLVWIVVTTVAAVLALLPATMPRLRPGYKREARVREERAARAARAARTRRANAAAPSPAAPAARVSADGAPTGGATSNAARTVGQPANGDHADRPVSTEYASPFPHPDPFPGPAPFPERAPFSETPFSETPFPETPFSETGFPEAAPFPEHAAYPGPAPYPGSYPASRHGESLLRPAGNGDEIPSFQANQPGPTYKPHMPQQSQDIQRHGPRSPSV